ncbi:protein VACUOLELESS GAMETOPHYTES-like [Mercurialis annua]|uniref:protein VACUOLELESS GAMETOPHYTES-like n=1 Tax=Mercurialis annua TaxID=3986 RepID=UPI00215EEBE0|nr:protein VACUOLELESS GAMETOPHYTES-like [Mercurialis annua]
MVRIEDEEEEPKYSHFTHEHPLELINSNQVSDRTTCSGCNRSILAGKDFYTCKSCSFSLHRVCYNMATVYNHPAEPGHHLNLILSPSFECKACGLRGSGFSYNCRICACNYHSLCLRMPLTESSAFHGHLLKLVVSPLYDNLPFKGFRCDVCGNPGSDHWLYSCKECEFDVHLNCIYSVPIPEKHTNLRILRAPPNETGAYDMNYGPSAPYINFSEPTASSMSNPGTNFVHPGVRISTATGTSGAGIAGLVATGILTGIGEGIGQEIVQTIFNNSDISS